MILQEAAHIAEKILAMLAPHCEPGFIHIAGSIRRNTADAGDIEIVCLPKKESTDLFDWKD